MDDDKDLPDATPDRDYDTLSELPDGQAPAERPKVPSTLPPPGSCDTHLHVLGGRHDFALSDDRTENPFVEHGFDGWIDLLRTHLDTLGIDRCVVVQSTFYGMDNAITVAALERLGKEARGIALVPDDAGDDVLDRLARSRIKGVRLNLVDVGGLSWEGAQRLAPRLANRDMHLQIQLRASNDLDAISDGLVNLPVPVVIDHCGLPDIAAGIDAAGFDTLRRLVGEGAAYVKLSGLFRFSGGDWDEADPFVAALAEANPERSLWASDWPHVRLGGAAMPDAGRLLDAFFRAVTDAGTRQRILVDNPASLYGF
ncbi:putative TIM-barrel fold metal-dependent hydrolase [Palleronia aestuarii]|uniref:Putative TIM-barrel fold metal-dependent hydrolase n=1 Tax=Palleronia aestuarii TaxID=568105 RepID=A0A2W7N7K9_9RHOB|nr:amidohydrolase family protein [Palleronia aestuarii]PZX16048.1 putative TIM-barrel fold metal-dependent hydrolase [Palleronia aestuarii]